MAVGSPRYPGKASFRWCRSWAGLPQRSAKQRTVGRTLAEEARIQRKAQTAETAQGVCWASKQQAGAISIQIVCSILSRPRWGAGDHGQVTSG